MPFVNIKITQEGAAREQKAELVAGATDLLVRVLDKNPATTFVVIDEVQMETGNRRSACRRVSANAS